MVNIASNFGIRIIEQETDKGVGFRSSTQPTKNSDGLKYDQGRKEFPEIRKELWGKAFWSPSYFLASVGQVILSDVKKYVENQGTGV